MAGLIKNNITSELRRKSRPRKLWDFMIYGRGIWLSFIIVFIALWFLWDWISGGVTNEILLPGPGAVVKALFELPSAPSITLHLKATIIELLVGFLIGAGGGTLLGFLFNFSKMLRRAIQPYVIFFQAIPKVAFVPLLFAWFGLGMSSKLALGIIASFFPAYINTLLGLTLIPETGVRLLYSYGATPWQRFKMLQVPNALPLIFAGIKTSLSYAFTGVVVAEFLGGNLGLGSLITSYNDLIRVDKAFAIIFVLAVLGLILYYGIEAVGRKLVFWEKGEGVGQIL